MRSLVTCMLIAVAASLAAAQTCVAPSANLFDVSGSCFMYCRIGLCACTGSNALSTFPTCLASNTGSCAATQTCYARYLQCLMSTVTTRSNASDPCSTLGTNLYMAQLAAAASSTFNTSNLAQSCGYATCVLANQTGNMGSCTGSAVSTAVCNAANLIGTAAPPTAWTPGVYDIVFTLRISGTSWNLILQNATAKALTFSALTADLARLWGIDAKWVVIQSLDVGSLVAVVAVQQGSSKSPSQLSTAISATQNTTASWLSSLQSLYSTVSSETLTTLGVTITQTAAPTTTLSPTTAPTSSGFGVRTLWATAAVAAVAALWV